MFVENWVVVEGEILKKVFMLLFIGFEDLVIRFLEVMGYG